MFYPVIGPAQKARTETKKAVHLPLDVIQRKASDRAQDVPVGGTKIGVVGAVADHDVMLLHCRNNGQRETKFPSQQI
ncbi:MAG: hypothetical protein AAGA12_08340 [Pseudomonadota bacterium]